jgi:hypothetical protein
VQPNILDEPSGLPKREIYRCVPRAGRAQHRFESLEAPPFGQITGNEPVAIQRAFQG